MENHRIPPAFGTLRVIIPCFLALSFLSCDRQHNGSTDDSVVESLEHEATPVQNEVSVPIDIPRFPLRSTASHPAPILVFDIRTPVGSVPETAPTNIRHGKPKRVEYVGFDLNRENRKVTRTLKSDTSGFVAFDSRSRVTAKGNWADGKITELRFIYDSNGRPKEFHTYRGKREVGSGTLYKLSLETKRILILSTGIAHGEVFGEETQVFDALDRMIECSIVRNNSRIRYEYIYEKGISPSKIAQFYPSSRSKNGLIDREVQEWVFRHDEGGRTINYTSLRVLGTKVLKRTTSFTYDESGNVIGATYGEGKEAQSTRFEYKFDEKGNWIDRIEVPVGGLKEGTGGGYEIERTISYWD